MAKKKMTRAELLEEVARLEQCLADAEHRFAAKLQESKQVSLEGLAGGVAHDFNNLLAGILGNASLARMKVEETSLAGRALGQIESATRRAAALVKKLLLYSGRAEWLAQKLDAAAVVRSTLDALAPELGDAVEVRREIAEELPEIVGDAGQLAELLTRLFDNAADALGEDVGTITVRLVRAAAPEETETAAFYLADNLRNGSEWVTLELADTGCGMDAAGRERLFDPFYTTKSGHRGLGLSEVLGIVRAHKGWIQVESRPGHGSTLRIGFPI